MCLLHFCPPRPKWNLTMSLICHFGAGALRVFVARDFLQVNTKSPRRRRRQNRFRLSLWTTGFFGQPEDAAQNSVDASGSHCAGSQERRHLESPIAVEECDAPVSCEGSDGRSGLHGNTRELLLSQIRSRLLLLSASLSTMVGTAKLFPKHLPRARVRAMERSSVQSNQCMDWGTTLKHFLEQRSGITLESRSPLLAWVVEHCSNLLLFITQG